MPRGSRDVRDRGRAHDRGDRRADHHRHEQGPSPRQDLSQPHDQGLSDARRLFRHGRHDPARRQLLPARRAGARGAQAGPLSPRARRRRQILARRTAEAVDGDAADLCARGRRRDQPDLRIAARPLPPRRNGRISGAAILHSAAAPDRHLLALGGQAPRSVRRRHLQVLRRQDVPFEASPDRRRQDGAGRREQSGHFRAGRQDRYSQARAFLAARSRRLQLFGRPQPHHAGTARIRRDVQGADQGSASAADGDAGGQLRGHRKSRRVALPGRDPRPFQRVGMGGVQEQQEQRSVPRPHLRRQGALLPARHRRSDDLRQAA